MAAFYNIMFYGGLTLAIIFAVIAIVLFFVLKIPKAVGEVTGSTAKKKIEEIREKGYESVQGAGVSKKDAIKNHSTKISVRDVNSSATKDTLKKGRANYEKAVAELHSRNEASGEEATDVLREDDFEEATDILREDDFEGATDVLREDDFEEATDVLREDDSEGATDVLREDDSEEATDILREDDSEEVTDILREDDSEGATDVLREDDSDVTDVLSDDEEVTDNLKSSGYHPAQTVSLKMIRDVVVTHSEESI